MSMLKSLLKDSGKYKVLGVIILLIVIAFVGLSKVPFVAIKNTSDRLNMDYDISVKNSDGVVYTWKKGESIPEDLKGAVLHGSVGLCIAFHSSNVEILNVYLIISGNYSKMYNFSQSVLDTNQWGYTLNTGDFGNGTYLFNVFATVDVSNLYTTEPTNDTIQDISLEAFRVKFDGGWGTLTTVMGIPIEIVAIVGIVFIGALFLGAKRRYDYF